MFGESAVGMWNGSPVCGDEKYGEYLTLKGGGRHGQLVTRWSISMGLPALTPFKHHTQTRIGSVGAESPRERRSCCVL